MLPQVAALYLVLLYSPALLYLAAYLIRTRNQCTQNPYMAYQVAYQNRLRAPNNRFNALEYAAATARGITSCWFTAAVGMQLSDYYLAETESLRS